MTAQEAAFFNVEKLLARELLCKKIVKRVRPSDFPALTHIFWTSNTQKTCLGGIGITAPLVRIFQVPIRKGLKFQGNFMAVENTIIFKQE